MGTSISQPSARNTNWKPVHIGYTSKDITEDRIVKEIWRASESDSKPISSEMKSETIYSCYKAIEKSQSAKEALNKINKIIFENKSNSITAEFAKRTIPNSFESVNPAHTWTCNFFSEITRYFISRDTSGFVGDNCRNRNINELTNFKNELSSKVNNIIKSSDVKIKSHTDWISFISKSIDTLKNG